MLQIPVPETEIFPFTPSDVLEVMQRIEQGFVQAVTYFYAQVIR